MPTVPGSDGLIKDEAEALRYVEEVGTTYLLAHSRTKFAVLLIRRCTEINYLQAKLSGPLRLGCRASKLMCRMQSKQRNDPFKFAKSDKQLTDFFGANCIQKCANLD